MSTDTMVLHRAAIGIGNVRLFRAPFNEPHLPWHAPDDLLQATAVNRKLRRLFRANLVIDWPGEVRTIRTCEGKTLIASHIVAQGLIDALADMGLIRSDFYADYARAGGEAMDKLVGGMSPLDQVNFTVEAFRRTSGMPGPHPKIEPESIITLPRGDRA